MAGKLNFADVENVIEVAWVYQSLFTKGILMDDIDSIDAKQKILYIAQAFEKEWNEYTEEEATELDYYEEIEKYAKTHLLCLYGKGPTMTRLSALIFSINYISHNKEFRDRLLKEVEEEMDRVIKNEVPCEDKRSEMIGCIIDIFEDFLEVHKVNISNKERNKNDDNAAIIYGDDYSSLSEQIERTLINFGILK